MESGYCPQDRRRHHRTRADEYLVVVVKPSGNGAVRLDHLSLHLIPLAACFPAADVAPAMDEDVELVAPSRRLHQEALEVCLHREHAARVRVDAARECDREPSVRRVRVTTVRMRRVGGLEADRGRARERKRGVEFPRVL